MGTYQSPSLPPFRPPVVPPALPAYTPPPSPALPTTHRYCVDCRCPKPRTDFQPIFRDDPYGLAETPVRQLRQRLKRAGRKPTKERLRLVREQAQLLGNPENKPLRTQPRCYGCNSLRGRRNGSIGNLKRSLAFMGFNVTLARSSDHASATIIGAVPEEALETGILEDLATGGVVLLDEVGNPRFPQDPILALRTCYATLLSDRFDGAIGVSRAKVLRCIPELARRNKKHALAKRAEDVIDVALVREGGALASVAMERLLSRYWRRYWRRASRAIKSGALDAHEASARLAEGIFDAAISWDPLHVSCAAFATHAWNRVGRSLQLRGRKDFAIAVTKGDDGLWMGGAASLSAMTSDPEAGSLMPNAIDYSAGRPAPRVSAARRDLSLRESVQHDVVGALDILSVTDRQIAEMLWATPSRFPVGQVADAVGLSVPEVKARAKQVQALLVVMLADYCDTPGPAVAEATAPPTEVAVTGAGASENEVAKLRQTLLRPPLLRAAERPKPQKQAGPGVLQRAVASISGKRALLTKATDRLTGLKAVAESGDERSGAAVVRQELKARTAAARLVFVLNRWYEMVGLATKNMGTHLAMRQKFTDAGKDTDEVDAVVARLKAVLAFGAQQAVRGREHAVRYGERGFRPFPVLELKFDYRDYSGLLLSDGALFDVAAYVDKEGIAGAAEFVPVPVRGAAPQPVLCSAPSSFY